MSHAYELPDGFYAATSVISDGNMDFRFSDAASVVSARQVFCNAIPHAQVAVCTVEHSDRIIAVHQGMDTREPFLCDALITTEKQIGLFLLTADCIPLIFVDARKKIIALAHLGWKPTALSLTRKVIERMRALGASADGIHIYAGPGIHAASYLCENPAQRSDPAWAECITHVKDDTYAVDLYKKNYLEILASGIPAEHVHMDAPDTATDTHFFSHYRAKHTGETEGRIATCVVIS